MKKKKWYNSNMSRINQKPNWQSKPQEEEYETPEIEPETNHEVNQMIEPKKQIQNTTVDSGLDINLVISSFQEKIGQLMTEVVIKDATIKQLTSIINTIKGQSNE